MAFERIAYAYMQCRIAIHDGIPFANGNQTKITELEQLVATGGLNDMISGSLDKNLCLQCL